MRNLELAASFLVFCVLPLGTIYALLRWYQHWLSLPRPGDIPQIKAELEANEHRVIDIRPDGFERGSLGRNGGSQSYRKYLVTISNPLGGPDEVQLVGVQAGLLAFRRLKAYGPRRHRDFDGPVA